MAPPPALTFDDILALIAANPPEAWIPLRHPDGREFRGRQDEYSRTVLALDTPEVIASEGGARKRVFEVHPADLEVANFSHIQWAEIDGKTHISVNSPTEFPTEEFFTDETAEPPPR